MIGRPRRLPRPLHPVAWWLWALGLATAATKTTNPIVLLLLVGVAAVVVAARRTAAPWARGFHVYVTIGLVVIAIRIGFRILLGGGTGTHALFTLPELDLPDAAAGIRIGGTVTLESILAALYDGIRLATLLLCVGAANVLADPKRLLKSLPPALNEIGVAVTIALTTAPQMIESGQRIRRARTLRVAPERRRRHPVRSVLVSVLEDALDRSLALAAAMDSRGFGRSAGLRGTGLLIGRIMLLVGVCLVLIGTYGVLDSESTAGAVGGPALVAGCVLGAAGIRVSGRRVARTVYRPEPWRVAETAVALCGVTTAALMFVAVEYDAAVLYPTVQPPRWPTLALWPVLAVAAALAPAVLAPPPDLQRDT